jgi:hypothetical protein
MISKAPSKINLCSKDRKNTNVIIDSLSGVLNTVCRMGYHKEQHQLSYPQPCPTYPHHLPVTATKAI